MVTEIEQLKRYTDHLKQESDHDLLIKLHENVTSICRKQDSNKEDFDAYIEKMDKRCDHRLDVLTTSFERKFNSITFWKIFWVFALIMFAFGSTITYNSIAIERNSTVIKEQGKIIIGATATFDRGGKG